MTVSLPAAVPTTTPAAARAGAAAPGKTVTAGSGKPAHAGDEHSDVTDMFAALVAALTQQMQPAAIADQSATAAGDPAVAAADGTVATGELFVAPAVVADGGETAVALPVDPTAVAVPGTEVVNTDGAAEGDGELPVAPTDAAPVGELTDLDTPDASETDAADSDADGELRGPDRAATKRPAWAGSDARDVRPTPPSGTTPAMPAQPAQGSGPATPAVPATPAATSNRNASPVDGVGVAPAPAVAPTTQVEAPTAVAAPPAPATEAHVQIARVVRPLRLGDDGAYELALDLTPAELGRVRIDVELRGATINLHLRADNPATRELLQASMDQLRAELEAAGLHAGSLDIGGRGNSDRPTRDADGAPTFSSSGDEPAADDLRHRAPTTVTDTSDGLNVLA